MNDSRPTTIHARNATPDRSSGDDDAQVSTELVLKTLAQIAQGDLSVLANGKQLALAGKDRHLLFITASKGLYAVQMRVKGAGSQ